MPAAGGNTRRGAGDADLGPRVGRTLAGYRPSSITTMITTIIICIIVIMTIIMIIVIVIIIFRDTKVPELRCTPCGGEV